MEERRRELWAKLMVPGANRSQLCREARVSRTTGYRLLARYRERGEAAFGDASRRPHHSPGRTRPEVEAQVLGIRDSEPTWGGRKIRRRLKDVGAERVPAISTITAILHRHGRIDASASAKRQPYTRFERTGPNELWQMDFKGHFALGDGVRCHALTILDDHSRYCIELHACGHERGALVRERLERAFGAYGLPEAMLMDNGPPWGTEGQPGYSALEVWLMRLGIRVLHGRPRHPQTQGKEERFHRTLAEDVVGRHALADLAAAQRAFDGYRPRYNEIRPHEALGLDVPASRYRPSERAMPATLPAIEYEEGDAVRKVQHGGWISYGGREWRIAKAMRGLPVAIRETETPRRLAVYFCRFRIAELDCGTGNVRRERA